jgi:hypothetical protein
MAKERINLAPFQIKHEGIKTWLEDTRTGKRFGEMVDPTKEELKFLVKMRNKANTEFALSTMGIY